MAYPTDRVILFDRSMNPLPELAPSEVFSRVRSEEINAEHELVIVTTRRLEEGWRVLTVDGTGKWHEWVVTEPDESHQSGANAIGTYRLVWSLQYDLTASYAHVDAASIGLGSSMTSQQVAAKVLEGVARWTVGTCDAPDIADGDGVVFIYESSWSKLSKVVGVTGWEVDAEIEVSNLYGVTARKLCLLGHMGSTEATRRFDWGEDVSEIKRTPDPGPYYCRVVPLGRGETEYADDDETTFEWPMDITEETGSPSLYYIEDAEAAAAFRMPDGNGGWWYPTKAVSYDEDDPELLLAAAQDDLLNHTRPGVSYEATVQQFTEAGLDAHGVELGDDIQIVDHGFNPDAALRLQGRVIKIELDELSPESSTVLTIGSLSPNMSTTFAQSLATLTEKQTQVANAVAKLNTASYVRSLLDRLNQEINATGGYSYLVEGEGIITYNTAVSNPLVGSEASQVVQIKGGSIRIANSKNAGFAGIDDWDWKTVFTSGHIAANLVTAAQITTGYIGNITNNNYWNLDNGKFELGYTLNSIFHQDSLTISSYRTLSNRIDYTGFQSRTSYLIRFNSNYKPSNKLRVLIGRTRSYTVTGTNGTVYGCLQRTSEIYPKLVSVSYSGSSNTNQYQYQALVTVDGKHSTSPESANMGWRIWFAYGGYAGTANTSKTTNWAYNEPSSYTVTDIDVYPLPNSGGGTINLMAYDTNGVEAAGTTLSATAIAMTMGDRRLELSPGVIDFGNGEYPAEIQLSESGTISYDPDEDVVRIGNTVNYSNNSSTAYENGVTATISFTKAKPNLLPGYLGSDGMLYYSYSNSKVMTLNTDAVQSHNSTGTNINLRKWGPIAVISGFVTTSSSIDNVYNIKVGTLNSEFLPIQRAEGLAYRSMGTIQMCSVDALGNFYIEFNGRSSFSSGAQFRFSLIYFVKLS